MNTLREMKTHQHDLGALRDCRDWKTSENLHPTPKNTTYALNIRLLYPKTNAEDADSLRLRGVADQHDLGALRDRRGWGHRPPAALARIVLLESIRIRWLWEGYHESR